MAGRRWERSAWRILEGIRVSGIVWHQWLAVQRSVSKLGEEAEVRIKLTVSWNEYRR